MHPRTDHLIDLALEEDAGLGDVTSEAIFPRQHRSRATITAKQDLVVCGLDVAARVFQRVDASLKVRLLAEDGDAVRKGRDVLAVEGPTISLLIAERTALNFLQRLSGIATHSREFARVARATRVRVVDTRKTTPGYRALEKYAVRCGGCHNHRGSLGEHVLIKDNHIAAAGSLTRAVQLTRSRAPHTAKIEVEAATFAQVSEACAVKADVILLDNMGPAQVREAVALIKGRALVEVSGGVRLDTIEAYATAGVDIVSVGALTHSAPSADLSLNIVPGSKLAAKRTKGRENRPR